LTLDDKFFFYNEQVEKQRMNMTMKTQQSEEAKTEYANQLQKTNDMQTLHYHTAMPEVFQHLQVILCHNCAFTFYHIAHNSYVMLFKKIFSLLSLYKGQRTECNKKNLKHNC